MAISNFQGTGWNEKKILNVVISYQNIFIKHTPTLKCSSCKCIQFIIKILNLYLNSSNIVLFVENLKIQVEILHLNTVVHFNQDPWKLIQTDSCSKIMFNIYPIFTCENEKKIKHADLRNLNSLYSSEIINKCICSTFLLHTCTRQIQNGLHVSLYF